MIFYELEPFGAEASYLGHAITASTVANVNRGKGKKAYKPDNFMPSFEHKKAQSVDDMIGFASRITKAFGGKDKRQ